MCPFCSASLLFIAFIITKHNESTWSLPHMHVFILIKQKKYEKHISEHVQLKMHFKLKAIRCDFFLTTKSRVCVCITQQQWLFTIIHIQRTKDPIIHLYSVVVVVVVIIYAGKCWIQKTPGYGARSSFICSGKKRT